MISVLTIGSLYWLSVSASYKQRDGVQQCTSNIARISLEACKNFLRQKYFREIYAQPKPETISSLGEQSLKSVAKNLLGDMSFTEYNCLLFQENPSSHSWITCRYLTEKFGPHSKGNMCSLFLAPVYIPCMNNFSQPLSFVKIQIWVLHVLCLVFVFVFLSLDVFLSLGTSSFFLASPARVLCSPIHSRTWEKYQLSAFCILTQSSAISYILRQGGKWSNIYRFKTQMAFSSLLIILLMKISKVRLCAYKTSRNQVLTFLLLIFNLVEPTQQNLHSGYLSGAK